MTGMMPAHFLDVTYGTILSATNPPKDLGWSALPGPLQGGMLIHLDSRPYQVAGFKFSVATTQLPPGASLANVNLNLPVLEIFVHEPGRAPASTGLVGAGAGALDELKRVRPAAA